MAGFGYGLLGFAEAFNRGMDRNLRLEERDKDRQAMESYRNAMIGLQQQAAERQNEQFGLMRPYYEAQAGLMQKQALNYLSPQQQQEMEIARARELAKISASFREYNKQLVPIQDVYGNVQYRVFDPRQGSFSDMPQGAAGGPAQTAPSPSPSVNPALPAPDLGRGAPGANSLLNFGQSYDAAGNPVSLGSGVKWNKPQDMKLPDGSAASVQFDTTGRFYRPIGPAAKMGGQADANKYAGVVLEDIGRAKGLANDYWILPNTGVGAALNWIPGTKSKDLSATLDTIRANVGFDRLQQMRNSSPTGGALGQVSEMENKLLQSTLGSLEQSQSKDQFLRNLDRLQRTYLDIVHGPGNWTMDGAGAVVTAPGTAPSGPSNAAGDADALIRKYGFGGR